MTFILDKKQVAQDVARALLEDVGHEDITATLLPESLFIRAYILSREPMFVCGQAWSDAVFHYIDPSIQIDWHVKEGIYLKTPQRLCTLTGRARALLTAERTALNFLQTLSGTATHTFKYVQCLEGYPVRLLDTRKTIPGLRYAQKYAVHCAGGFNHRMGLYDAYLIKENHIKACGSIIKAIDCARNLHPEKFLEVEVETLDEFKEALSARPDRILLDNFNLDMMKQAVALNQSKIPLEVSGGVTQDTIVSIAQIGIDCISVGALTKHLKAIDLSLLIEEEL
jgi:nicotinate-nucleotide pyrophosphorylase (carboxylating)